MAADANAKPPLKGGKRILGMPWWAWAGAAVVGLVIGYMMTRGAGTASADEGEADPSRASKDAAAAGGPATPLDVLDSLGLRPNSGGTTFGGDSGGGGDDGGGFADSGGGGDDGGGATTTTTTPSYVPYTTTGPDIAPGQPSTTFGQQSTGTTGLEGRAFVTQGGGGGTSKVM